MAISFFICQNFYYFIFSIQNWGIKIIK